MSDATGTARREWQAAPCHLLLAAAGGRLQRYWIATPGGDQTRFWQRRWRWPAGGGAAAGCSAAGRAVAGPGPCCSSPSAARNCHRGLPGPAAFGLAAPRLRPPHLHCWKTASVPLRCRAAASRGASLAAIARPLACAMAGCDWLCLPPNPSVDCSWRKLRRDQRCRHAGAARDSLMAAGPLRQAGRRRGGAARAPLQLERQQARKCYKATSGCFEPVPPALALGLALGLLLCRRAAAAAARCPSCGC